MLFVFSFNSNLYIVFLPSFFDDAGGLAICIPKNLPFSKNTNNTLIDNVLFSEENFLIFL